MYTFSSKQIKYSNGFTIVELLVVVVVIAILAAITIIAYNGITRSAAESSLKSDLRTTATKIGLYQAENGTYPSALSNGMAAESSANSLTYSSLGNTYCLIATTKKVGGSTFHITEKGTVTAGECISPSVVAGSSHTLAVSSAGVLRAWGENFQGALGDGTTTNRTAPVTIAGGALTGKKIKLVAAGNHSLAVDDAGVLYAWGSNYAGQLGDGTTTDRLTPVAVTGGSLAGKTIVRVVAGKGGNHSFAVASDGTLHAWGNNSVGKLGNGTTTNQLQPILINGGTLAGKSVVFVAAGAAFSVALASDGSVHSWGGNGIGQLGDGTTTSRFLPGSASALQL